MNNDLKIAYATGENDPDSVLIHTLELLHDSFSAPVRITNALDDVDATLEATAPEDASSTVTFEAVPFNLVLPKVENNPQQGIQITISNIDRVASARLDEAIENPTPITVIYRIYLAGDLTGPAVDPPDQLTIHSAVTDKRQCVAQARSFDVINRIFPNITYNSATFPGLIR